MNEYDEECLLTFLKKQSQLFDEPVAETMEEAEAFLEDCMAVVVDSLDEVREYLRRAVQTWRIWMRKNSKRHLKYSRFQVDAI